MSTKAEVVAAIDAALVVAQGLDDQSALVAQLTQERDAAVTALANANTMHAIFKAEALALLDELTTQDAAEDAKRQQLRTKLGG